jgi:hypothetical protein
MVRLLDRLKPGDVLVLDRGYPSFEILCVLQDLGIDFVIRVPKSKGFGAIDDFVASGVKDDQVTITAPHGHVMKDHKSIDLRALLVPTPSDDKTILITSLPQADFDSNEIAELYRMRWEIELFYKQAKSDYLGQGQFHAKSARGVEQETHALALFISISRYLMAAAAEEKGVALKELSPKAGALGLGAYVLRLLLSCEPDEAASWLSALLHRIVRTMDPARPGRSCPRRSFRPTSKWGPGGRRGG